MIATWMLYGTAVALLVGIGALALERGARLLSRAGRWCWVGAMVVTLALPAVARFQPRILPPVITLPTQNGGTLTATPPVRIEAPAITYRTSPPLTWSDLNRPLAYGWGLLSLGLLAWFGIGTWRLRRMRRSWRADGDVLVSENVGPAVVGFLKCRVVVPEWSLDLGAQQHELLMAHEAEHLAAHDSQLLLLAAAVLALVPWNPGFWWQFRRLRLAIELDCDSRVLRRRPDPAAYGRLLLDVGARATRSVVPVAAFHEPSSSLEKRIRSMTAQRPKRAGLLAALMAVVAGGTGFFACEAPRPTAPAANREAFVVQTKEEEGRAASTFIADSVRHYFPAGVPNNVYVWFVLSPENHVLRYGTTLRRGPFPEVGARVAGREDLRLFRLPDADSVVPAYTPARTLTVTMIGKGALGPGSEPVYWVVLRDTSRPAAQLSPGVDSVALLPWVRDGMKQYYPDLLAAKNGPPMEVWFVSDAQRHVLKTRVVPLDSIAGISLGPTHLIESVFPGIANGTVRSITSGGVHGWARSNVRVVWVTVDGEPQ